MMIVIKVVVGVVALRVGQWALFLQRQTEAGSSVYQQARCSTTAGACRRLLVDRS